RVRGAGREDPRGLMASGSPGTTTPWWYHPALGLVVALLTASLALGAGSVIAVAVGVVLLPPLAVGGPRAGAPPLKAVGPRSRRLLVPRAGVRVVAVAA